MRCDQRRSSLPPDKSEAPRIQAIPVVNFCRECLLCGLVSTRGRSAVRADAIFAARFRRPLPASITDSVAQAAEKDPIDYVRSDAVALLRHLPASPDIGDVFAQIADRDSNSAIRREAREAMAFINAPASNTQ